MRRRVLRRLRNSAERAGAHERLKAAGIRKKENHLQCDLFHQRRFCAVQPVFAGFPAGVQEFEGIYEFL